MCPKQCMHFYAKVIPFDKYHKNLLPFEMPNISADSSGPVKGLHLVSKCSPFGEQREFFSKAKGVLFEGRFDNVDDVVWHYVVAASWHVLHPLVDNDRCDVVLLLEHLRCLGGEGG